VLCVFFFQSIVQCLAVRVVRVRGHHKKIVSPPLLFHIGVRVEPKCATVGRLQR